MKTLEYQIKCKNTRSSGKTLGVAPCLQHWFPNWG